MLHNYLLMHNMSTLEHMAVQRRESRERVMLEMYLSPRGAGWRAVVEDTRGAEWVARKREECRTAVRAESSSVPPSAQQGRGEEGNEEQEVEARYAAMVQREDVSGLMGWTTKLREMKRIQRKWADEWGSLKKEGNTWWLGNEAELQAARSRQGDGVRAEKKGSGGPWWLVNWRQTMGDSAWRWFRK